MTGAENAGRHGVILENISLELLDHSVIAIYFLLGACRT